MQGVLQAFAQVSDIHVYYGPDTYMGRNLAVMLRSVSQLSDEEISALHPAHNRATVKVCAHVQLMTAGSNEPLMGPAFWQHATGLLLLAADLPWFEDFLTNADACAMRRPCCPGCTASRRAPALCITSLALRCLRW